MKIALCTSINTNQIKTIDYSFIYPQHIAKLHYKYILEAKNNKTKTENSLYSEANLMKYFFQFLQLENISDLKDFNYQIMQKYFSFLSLVQTKQNKLLSKSSQRVLISFFKSFAKWLYMYYPTESPDLNIFFSKNIKGVNKELKTEYFNDFVLNQIKKALSKEESLIVKTYISIMLYYGIRSNDIVSLKSSCLVKSEKDNKFDLYYVDHKLNEEAVIYSIDNKIAKNIRDLILYTEQTRHDTKIDKIFFNKNKPMNSYQPSLLDNFSKRHNVIDERGNLVKIKSHMFRRTLATNMQSHGVNILTTKSILNHKHSRTTFQHYIKTKESDYIEQISKTLQHMTFVINSEQIEDPFFQENKLQMRLTDGYCTNSLMLIDEKYMCDTFIKRGNCFGCQQMVTTPEFIPYFENHLVYLSEQVKKKAIYGEHVVRQVEYEIELIQAIVKKLMGLQNDN